MQIPSRSLPVPTALRRSRRIIRIAQAIPGACRVVSVYETAVGLLEGRYDAWALARGEASVALGNEHEARAALDEELRGVGLTLLKLGRGRRGSDASHRYFPNGYGHALRLPVEKALEVASGVLAQMEDEAIARILACREDLTVAVSRLEAAIAARQAAANALGEARGLLEDEKLAWRKAHFDFFHAMRSLLFDRRAYVESIFRRSSRTQSDEEAGIPEETAEDAGSARLSVVQSAASPHALAPDATPAKREPATETEPRTAAADLHGPDLLSSAFYDAITFDAIGAHSGPLRAEPDRLPPRRGAADGPVQLSRRAS